MTNDFSQIQGLIELSRKAKEDMNRQLDILDGTFSELVKKLPKEEADQVDRLKGYTQRAINLAKKGKQEEANDIISKIRNEYKNTK